VATSRSPGPPWRLGTTGIVGSRGLLPTIPVSESLLDLAEETTAGLTFADCIPSWLADTIALTRLADSTAAQNTLALPIDEVGREMDATQGPRFDPSGRQRQQRAGSDGHGPATTGSVTATGRPGVPEAHVRRQLRSGTSPDLL
jgi:hypothetical protein